MLRLQDGYGRFPSRTYGMLAGGQTTTAAVVEALSRFPGQIPSPPLEAALAFLEQGAQDGGLGLPGANTEYPTYATALTLRALARLNRQTPKRRDLRAFLLRQQRRGAEWGPADGGFALGSRVPPQQVRPEHVDLSMTRRAVEALVADGLPLDGPELTAARRFVQRCRAPDSTFFYSPVDPALNKGVKSAFGSEGYGTATTDGLLALLALGVPPEDPELRGGWTALQRMHRWDEAPRLGPEHRGYAKAMRFYYRAGAAAVFRRLGGPSGWQEELKATLAAEQQANGTWVNEETLQKEDDPLIATSLGLVAWSEAS